MYQFGVYKYKTKAPQTARGFYGGSGSSHRLEVASLSASWKEAAWNVNMKMIPKAHSSAIADRATYSKICGTPVNRYFGFGTSAKYCQIVDRKIMANIVPAVSTIIRAVRLRVTSKKFSMFTGNLLGGLGGGNERQDRLIIYLVYCQEIQTLLEMLK